MAVHESSLNFILLISRSQQMTYTHQKFSHFSFRFSTFIVVVSSPPSSAAAASPCLLPYLHELIIKVCLNARLRGEAGGPELKFNFLLLGKTCAHDCNNNKAASKSQVFSYKGYNYDVSRLVINFLGDCVFSISLARRSPL